MTRVGYRMLIVALTLLCLSGVFATLVVSWKNQRAPESVDCREWAEHPREGRFRLTACRTVPMSRSGVMSRVVVGWDTTEHYDWTTYDPEMWRMTNPDAEGRRALARHLASRVEVDIVVQVEQAYDYTYELRDLRKPKLSPWVGVIPFFLFGLPLFWLVRRQRRWRVARLAWERSRGIVTHGDQPTAF